MMLTTIQDEPMIQTQAPIEKCDDLVSDFSRMGEWSPECYSARWVGDVSGPAVGAKFKGRNKQGWMRWSTTPEVVAAEPGREFAFKTRDTTWRYRFEPAGDGTDVTESFEVPKYGVVMNLLAPAKKREPTLVQ